MPRFEITYISESSHRIEIEAETMEEAIDLAAQKDYSEFACDFGDEHYNWEFSSAAPCDEPEQPDPEISASVTLVLSRSYNWTGYTARQLLDCGRLTVDKAVQEYRHWIGSHLSAEDMGSAIGMPVPADLNDLQTFVDTWMAELTRQLVTPQAPCTS